MAPHSNTLAWKIHGWRRLVGCSPWGHEESDTTEQLHFHFHALEKEMATHSSILAWRIPGTGEPGGLSSVGSHRVGHDWSDLAADLAAVAVSLGNFAIVHLPTGIPLVSYCPGIFLSLRCSKSSWGSSLGWSPQSASKIIAEWHFFWHDKLKEGKIRRVGKVSQYA